MSHKTYFKKLEFWQINLSQKHWTIQYNKGDLKNYFDKVLKKYCGKLYKSENNKNDSTPANIITEVELKPDIMLAEVKETIRSLKKFISLRVVMETNASHIMDSPLYKCNYPKQNKQKQDFLQYATSKINIFWTHSSPWWNEPCKTHLIENLPSFQAWNQSPTRWMQQIQQYTGK